ncbi:hypothetical protein AB0G73_10465 [Streptomyces sp. NPDC020719]|uniref:hypothetical protein n=1 Tax=Streptomyces sp. NPDC020719 TaxID=3154896 RepID=UPI0033E166C6
MGEASATSVPQVEVLGATPRITAGLLAQKIAPEVQQVLIHLMQIPGAAFAAGVTRSEGDVHEGLIHVALSTSEAQSFVEWVLRHASPDDRRAFDESLIEARR